MAGLQTEFEFILPKGYIDSEGNLHRKGVIRMATAMDEIAPLRDPRVKSNQAYLSIILLSRVVTRLGTLTDSDISPNLMERLFSADLAYLQGLYNRINSVNFDETVCPTCGRKLDSAEEATEATALGG
jgi:hypothetical protein